MIDVERSRRPRKVVTRPDGKAINVFPKVGHLFVCSNGCCCGHTDQNDFAPINLTLYESEWVRRKLASRVHLTTGGCLGPCALANVAMLLFAGRGIWFHSMNSDAQILALYDYIDSMLASGGYLEPPAALAPYHFTVYSWEAGSKGMPLPEHG